jgi:hypothetical protein
MKTKTSLIVLLSCSWMFSACQSYAVTVPTVPSSPSATPLPPSNTSVPPTNTHVPTNTPAPTETPEPTPTALPEGVLFRDDFEGELQPGWEWENENPAKWTVTDDGWLQIIGETNALLGQSQQNNLLWYPLPAGDFVITVHLRTRPFEDFQQAAIFIYEDPENYVTINRGYCSPCSTGGNGFYMDYKISGQWGDYSAATSAEDVYLRLESKGRTIGGYYATETEQWKRLGRFGNYFQFKKVGIGVSNAGAADDVVGQFDYFEISQP